MVTEPATIAEILDDEPVEPAPCAVRLELAVADPRWTALCSESCPHLRRTDDGDPRCRVWDDEPLHPSFEAEPITDTPRAERCTPCLVAEDTWGPRS
jgi:hypothetical protein